MIPLTPRQVEIMGFIVQHFEEHGRHPTIRELLMHFDLRSTNTVSEHLTRLETKGFLRRHGPGQHTGWQVVRLPDGTPVVPRLIRVVDAEAAR